MADEEPVLVREQRGNVLILRLNRPEARNALNGALMGALGEGIHEAESNPDIRAIVLTGTGDRSFCAGMDLRAFASGESTAPQASPEGMQAFGRFFGGGDVDVPIVGAAQATAVAGGFELLLNCDLVVAAETAQFGIPEVKRSLFAAGGGVYLSQRIPLAVALELGLTGDPIDATRAQQLGLVNQVTSADKVVDAAVELAVRIAKNGPLGLAATKKILRAAITDPDKARQIFMEWQPKVFSSNDAREGSLAFVEKREPKWTGT
ncbi:MAG TPA: enoyl-CoA hydratase-related protein [Acidimicrobiales bacterium]|nr:enoyl-CoA hydratase-related protein [Acidimicrobiales bacterium]